MKERTPFVLTLVAGSALALLFVAWLWTRSKHAGRTARPGAPVAAAVPLPGLGQDTADEPSGPEDQPDEERARLRAGLQHRLEKKDARPHEAVLAFKNEEAYRKFLARAEQAGLNVRGRLDALRMVRVGYDSIDALLDDMMNNAADYDSVSANYYVHIPSPPPPENRPNVSPVPFGDGMLGFLGVTGDHSQWGRGITIAVLDSGVAPDPTFGQGRLQTLDLGFGTTPGTGKEDGHGTAVAALAAGGSPGAPGVAPAADLLSIRVTGQDGMSDTFSMAQAVLAAVDAGARIINISMGAYYDTSIMSNAIGYASEHGAVVVASAGNDQAAQLTWPAADPRVISVGAVDALGQQVYFSNSGPQLQMTAPGYGIDTAWLNGQRVVFDGTSASAPIVAGAIAAMMSENPGMSASQAWQVLQKYASDGGPPGPDPDYGNGILNLGWAMSRNDPTRIDTAISGQYYNSATGILTFVVQNRSGQAINGLELNVEVGGVRSSYPLPWLNPAATHVIEVPVDPSLFTTASGVEFRTQLVNPNGVTDKVPANNFQSGRLFSQPPGK